MISMDLKEIIKKIHQKWFIIIIIIKYNVYLES